MNQHLERLLGFNITEKFEQSLLSKKDIIFDYFTSKAASMKQLAARLSAVGDSKPAIAVIHLLLTYFREQENSLLVSREVCL